MANGHTKCVGRRRKKMEMGREEILNQRRGKAKRGR